MATGQSNERQHPVLCPDLRDRADDFGRRFRGSHHGQRSQAAL